MHHPQQKDPAQTAGVIQKLNGMEESTPLLYKSHYPYLIAYHVLLDYLQYHYTLVE